MNKDTFRKYTFQSITYVYYEQKDVITNYNTVMNANISNIPELSFAMGTVSGGGYGCVISGNYSYNLKASAGFNYLTVKDVIKGVFYE